MPEFAYTARNIAGKDVTGSLSAGDAAELLIETVEPGLRARTTGET
jgi:hypothetical protein